MNSLGQTFWGFCNILRHDGVNYGSYIEEIIYLLFLKMADDRKINIPEHLSWQSLKSSDDDLLIKHYKNILADLAKEKGLLADIYFDSKTSISNGQNLRKLVNAIDKIDWTQYDGDVKGQAFEDLLERTANEGKKGTGQYFTPRPLIRSIVRVMKPDAVADKEMTIADPACGTAGFLISAYEWLVEKYSSNPANHHNWGDKIPKKDQQRIKSKVYYGQELVIQPARIARMNMFLRDVDVNIKIGDTIYTKDEPLIHSCFFANPPFGTKDTEIPQRGFQVKTSNKQLNFVQHIVTTLKDKGRAAIVLPDNVLFETKASAVFEHLMASCNVHTILRLPRGTFAPYAAGVKANVVFLQKGLPTEATWIYDARANVEGFTKKDRPLTDAFFADFEKAYGKDPDGKSVRKEIDRFRKFTIENIKARDYKLDITWLKDESLESAESLLEPLELATEAVQVLEAAIVDLKEIIKLLEA